MGRAGVASGHPLVSEAAAKLLGAGGNAFDAALAAGFAASIAEPMFTSLGGGGFLLAHSSDGSEVLFDFFADTPGRGRGASAREPHFVPMTVRFPASEQIFNIGLGSVAVPGTLAGLLHVHERLGRRSLDEVVAPAIALARDGVVLNAHQAYVIALLEPINTLTAEGRALYAPGGRVPEEGERLYNRDLARFLASLAVDGRGAFYRGSVADGIAGDMSGGGLLTREDLAGYRVVERPPLSISYRGHRVLTNPPPSFGGSLIALSLGLMEAVCDPTAAADPTRRLLALAGVMAEVEAQREAVSAPVASLAELVAASVPRARRASGGTTHVSVCDDEGNAASLSLSNGEGSGYVAPGTGIMLNNMLGEDDLHPDGFHQSDPGERVASMMAPTVVLEGRQVRLILGSGGSKRIRTAILQVLTRVVDAGEDVAHAVPAPRIHWDGESLQLEPGLPDAAVNALAQSWPVNRWPDRNLYFGGVHAIQPGVAAAGDPRREGDARMLDGSG